MPTAKRGRLDKAAKDRVARAFGVALKERRNQAGVSQVKLSEEAGVDKAYIARLERGDFQPSLLTIFRLAKALKVTPNALVKATEEHYRRRPD